MSVDLTNFIPKRRLISAVTNATRAQVTTTEDHGYEVGQFVRLIVPLVYGMELNYIQAEILSIPTLSSFITDINTVNNGVYATPSAPPSFTESQVVPISGLEENDTSITG